MACWANHARRRPLSHVLLRTLHSYGLGIDGVLVLLGLYDATARDAPSLPIGLLVFLHDVLESLLVKIAALLALVCLVDVLRPSSRQWHHQILSVPRSWHLRLHTQVIRRLLISMVSLLLAEPKYNLVNNFVSRIWRLRRITLRNQFWIFMADMLLIWVVVAHCLILLTTWSDWTVAVAIVLTSLWVEMASDTCLIPTGNRTFYLFAALTLANVVAKWGILLRIAIFTFPDWYWRSLSISRTRIDWLSIGLLSLSVRSLETITVVLAAVIHMIHLALILLLIDRLPTANELRTTCTCSFLKRLLAADVLLILVG